MAPWHLISINDLTVDEMETVFQMAENDLGELAESDAPYRIARSTDTCGGSVMAALFHEPSTRTRLSFESAMLRLGGSIISSADPKASSAAKGESLADAVRIVSAYADLIVLRHPRDGAAKLAAEHARVPVINGGDGGHEHPTQTLCDLFTMRREKGGPAGLNVAVLGDLKGGRTVHSLVLALARFGTAITTIPAPGLGLPEPLDWRLRNEFGYIRIPGAQLSDILPAQALYLPAGQAIPAAIDVLYVTRFQKERASEQASAYPTVNPAFVSTPALRSAVVMHPLPRLDELDPALDGDSRAAYFRQASYGVPVRMALIRLLLGKGAVPIPNHSETTYRGLQRPSFRCANANCISRDLSEARTAPPKYLVVADGRLRCFYCEQDTLDLV